MQLGSKVRHIVWIQTGFLGDIILTTAAFRWLRAHYPEVKQSLITTPLGAKALASHPDLDDILVFDKRGQGFFAAAKALHSALAGIDRAATVIAQIHRSARSSLLARWLGLPVVTYEETKLAWLARWRVPRIAVLHETQRILLLLEALGVSRADFKGALPSLPVASESPLGASIKTWGGDSRIVGIAPGSVWGTKRWPAENFRELARKLLAETSTKIVLIGSPNEKAAADEVELADVRVSGRLKNLVGQTSLDELRSLFPQLDLLVSNDSSPLHYASSFRIPTVAIFGATVPGLGFGPLGPGSRIAEIDLPCRPCSDHGPQTCPLGHFRCMREQTPDQVYQIVIDTLEGNKS